MVDRYHARWVLRGTQTERRAYDTDQLQTGTIWLETSSTYVAGDAPQVYIWTGDGWMRLAATDLVRFGEITKNDEDVAGYGMKVYFSGGPSFSGGGDWDSENSDSLWMARYNVATDSTELRINIGDNDSAIDALSIGYTDGGWNEVYRFETAKQAHIIDADGTLADITTKFNTLLSELEALGLISDV